MSKAYANFQLAELVPQVGDPLVSPDRGTEVRANNGGTASVVVPGDVTSYDVTYDVPGTNAHVTLRWAVDTGDNDHPDFVSAEGIEDPSWDPLNSGIYSGGSYWGEPIAHMLATEVSESRISKIDPTGRVLRFFLKSTDTTTNDWSTVENVVENRTTVTKTIATTDQIPGIPAATSSDVSKILGVTDSSGTLGWVPITTERYTLSTPEQTTSGTTVSLALNDKSINQVSLASTVTGATVSFPAKVPGYARDFFVRLTITGSTVPAITWQEANGDPIDFDVDDDSWADIEQGVNILMFTETNQASAS